MGNLEIEQVSCVGNLNRFFVWVTWTLLGQVPRVGNLDAA